MKQNAQYLDKKKYSAKNYFSVMYNRPRRRFKMKKSSRLLHNNTAARRSRQRQMFIKDARARRQARQEVFFIQEKSSS